MLLCLMYLAINSVALNESKLCIISLKLGDCSSFPFGPSSYIIRAASLALFA